MMLKTTVQKLMNQSGVKFGTSGARGLVADMTGSVCFAYTLGFLQYARRQFLPLTFDRVAVAYDLRMSSPRIAQSIRAAVRHFGCQPIDCSAVPSPTVAYYGLTEKIPSIMVTGSHIPEDRNGIKFNLPTGEILKRDEEGIRQEFVEVPDPLPDYIPSTVSRLAEQRYLQRFRTAFPEDFLRGCRIGLYEHSAVGRDILFDLYTSLGATVERLDRSEQFVAIDTEAVRDEDFQLARQWACRGFDAIVSTDGDSDRPLVFDENGDWIRGDIACILTSQFLDADCVVAPINCNTALEKTRAFRNIVRTKIGSPFVVESMQQALQQGFQRVVGYEANGGFLTAADCKLNGRTLTALPTRDAAIVHLSLLGLARQRNVPLSQLTKDLPQRFTMSGRLQNIPPELAQRKLTELERSSACSTSTVFGKLQSVDLTDGVRMTFADDIVHIRASGNAPELRCYVEAATDEHAAELLKKGLAILTDWQKE